MLRHSYGIIPVFWDGNTPEFLLINQIDGRKGTAYWTFPKGTPEKGESPVETARREVAEEVGITFDVVDASVAFDSQYTFDLDGTPTDKIATYFLGEAASKETVLQVKEVSEAAWLPYEAARERLTYERSREILDEVYEHLKPRLSAEK